MTDWLMANPKAGDGERNERFWRDHLEQAGVAGARRCDLEDTSWVQKVRPEDRILAAGGDGSVNAAAAICLKTGATLAVLPSGTANDFFRNLGIDNDPQAICQALRQEASRAVDVGEYQDGLCLNVAHVGLGAMPARDANANGSSKKRLGQFSYLLSLVRRLFSRRGFRATISTDSASVGGRWLSVAIANGAYFGGGTEVPDASITNGRLVVIAVRPASVGALTGAFIRTRLLRRPPGETKTVVELSCQWCEVTPHHRKTVTVDGDVAGETPFRLDCRPGKLKVVMADRADVDQGAQ